MTECNWEGEAPAEPRVSLDPQLHARLGRSRQEPRPPKDLAPRPGIALFREGLIELFDQMLILRQHFLAIGIEQLIA
jgi:hypothetical protein